MMFMNFGDDGLSWLDEFQQVISPSLLMLNTLKSLKLVVGKDKEIFKMHDPRRNVCDIYVLLRCDSIYFSTNFSEEHDTSIFRTLEGKEEDGGSRFLYKSIIFSPK
jgi:hypothetical protein